MHPDDDSTCAPDAQVLQFYAWRALREKLHTELDTFLLDLTDPTTEDSRRNRRLRFNVAVSNAVHRAYAALETDEDQDEETSDGPDLN